jgi:nucleoside-diphosphate-sugar epimerase
MKVLILGGTGAMGTHLINVLSNMQTRVTVTSRGQHKSEEGIEYVQGNAKNLQFLNSILKSKWDVIVDFMIYSEKEFCERINLLLNSTHHYIFLSSARVYNKSTGPITEETLRLLDSSSDYEFLKTREYSLSKARQENILYSMKQKNWTIIRPYITYSENRLQLGNLEKEEWLYRALNGRTIVFSEDIKGKLTTLTHGLDVAITIRDIIENTECFGQTYHITSQSIYTWEAILDIYLDVLENKLGYRPNVVYQKLTDFLSWNSNTYQIIYDRLFDRKFNNEKIKKVVGDREFLRVEVGLKQCLHDFLDKCEFKNINWKNEALKDKYCKEKTSLRDIKGTKARFRYLSYRYFLRERWTK